MPSTLALLGLALAVLAASVAVARVLLGRARRLEVEAESVRQELAIAKRLLTQAEADQQLLSRLVRELPHLTHQMHSQAAARQMPHLLLGAAVRLLEPKTALVGVRRRGGSDPSRPFHLAIAAVSPEGAARVGAEIPIETGEVGFAVEARRVMDRKDFDGQSAARHRFRDEALPGVRPDLVAPLVFEEEVLGVIVLEGVKHSPTHATDVLRLLAQVAAASAYAHARLSAMKTTADVDGLTGIFNKRYLLQRLAEDIKRALDRTQSLSIFMFDLDNFKHYNDHNGHLAGDQLLRQLTRLVHGMTRSGDAFGRFGGEEFLLILPNATKEQARAVAEKIRVAIAAHPFDHAGEQPLHVVSISGGVAECPIDATDGTKLIRCADEALYAAKHAGRNRVLAFAPRYFGEGGPAAAGA